MGENQPYFDKTTTNIIKGVALIMMFVHHFFTFPQWWGDGISYPFIESIAPYFNKPLQICVPVFCFITGYFYLFGQKKTYRYSLRKIIDILIPYWIIFAIFAVTASVVLNYRYTLHSVLGDVLATDCNTMKFCWYVNFYITFMLLLPAIKKILGRHIVLDIVIIFVAIPVIIRLLDYCIVNEIVSKMLKVLIKWIACVLIGYVFATYNLFTVIVSINKRVIRSQWINIIIWIILAICIPMGRYFAPSVNIPLGAAFSYEINLDVIYAPLFIYVLVNLIRSISLKHIHNALGCIGKYSLLMWFMSCGFFNNCKEIYQPVLYLPHNPILVVIWGLIICLMLSYIMDFLMKRLYKLRR